jgi:hypothetical protein
VPVDLILSTAVCLVWYDVKTFGSNDLPVSGEKPGLTNFRGHCYQHSDVT